MNVENLKRLLLFLGFKVAHKMGLRLKLSKTMKMNIIKSKLTCWGKCTNFMCNILSQ